MEIFYLFFLINFVDMGRSFFELLINLFFIFIWYLFFCLVYCVYIVLLVLFNIEDICNKMFIYFYKYFFIYFYV